MEVKDLSRELIYSRVLNVNWSNGTEFNNWESWEGVECENCGKSMVCQYPSTICPRCGFEIYVVGPVINFFYPLRKECPESLALELKDLPFCVVSFSSDRIGFVSTYDSLNTFWDVCEAYMILGYLPPLCFIDLPEMAGRGESKKDKRIISACKRTAKVSMNLIEESLMRLDSMQLLKQEL